MNESSDQSQAFTPVRYEIAITVEEARLGTKKILSRQGKKLEVNIRAGVKTGSTVKLSNALQITDGHPGDILIQVKVEEEKIAEGVIEINDGNFEMQFARHGGLLGTLVWPVPHDCSYNGKIGGGV